LAAAKIVRQVGEFPKNAPWKIEGRGWPGKRRCGTAGGREKISPLMREPGAPGSRFLNEQEEHIMRVWQSLLVVFGLAAGLAAFAPAQARAANHYATVYLHNPFSLTITYEFRWGDGDWKSFDIPPNTERVHYWPYNVPDENRSPKPQIRFVFTGAPGGMKTYDLQAYASPDLRFHPRLKHFFASTPGGVDLFRAN
jgi:hypothetical protein